MVWCVEPIRLENNYPTCSASFYLVFVVPFLPLHSLLSLVRMSNCIKRLLYLIVVSVVDKGLSIAK